MSRAGLILFAPAAAVNFAAEWVITLLAGAFLVLMLIRGLMHERAHRRRVRKYDEARKRHWQQGEEP